MEPARLRADQEFFGPRAGRLQHNQLHFAIWHICPRFVTIRLCSLRPAHFSDAKFLRQPSVKKLCAKSGNVRPIAMAGGWDITFQCRTTCTFSRDQQSMHDLWLIGCRCGKASALDESRRRLPSIRRSGRRIILIDISDPAKATLKNGITLSKTQFGLASSRP